MQKKQKNQPSFMGGCLKKIGGTSGLVIIIVFAFILGYLGLRGLGAYLIVSSNLQPVDAIVILSGGDETRVDEALKLYKENYSRTIILTNTSNNIPSGEYGAVQGSDARVQLMGNGVPGGNILFTEVRVSSTRDEALAIRQMMEDHKLHSCIIVTDPYHSRRALTIFEDIFEKTIFHVYVQPVEDSWYNSRTWFLSLDGWKYTLLEYVKLIAYKFGIIMD
jgi:uncharacterized SAM-binding protein YcdF (DUF218 family)